MLVLGHTLADLILGSTAADCLRHAKCAVVLVSADSIFSA